jgi:hypothetical protein
MDHLPLHLANLVTIKMDSIANNIVLMASLMSPVTFAQSLLLTDVVKDMEIMTIVSVNILILVVKGGEPFFTLNAEQTSTMSLAASAHQIAPLS